MDLTALVTRHVLLPAYLRWTGSRQLSHYRRMKKSQFLPEEQIRERQWQAVQALIRYAYDHTRFYRARFDELGARPDDIRDFQAFARLPLLSKANLRESAAELTSDAVAKSEMALKRTGGSTGVPVRLHWDLRAEEAKAAIAMRHDEWAHFEVAAKKAALWGNVQPRTTAWRKLAGALHERTIFLDTLKMDDASMLEFVDAIRRSSTRLLFGHGHSIYYLARFVQERGITDLKFDGIISSAEMLPPAERRVVEETFGNVVFDRYGCEEVGLIASECEQREGLHVAAEGVYVEILDGTAEEPGRVIVTDLVNRATPLLRYEIGDLATALHGSCRCGRGLPRIGRVTGRTSDILYCPDGRRISGISLLDTVTIHIPGVKQVQVVQEVIDKLTFNVVKDAGFDDRSRRMLAEAVTRYFGAAMRHEVVVVDRIPLTGRGKFQFSICKLDPSSPA